MPVRILFGILLAGAALAAIAAGVGWHRTMMIWAAVVFAVGAAGLGAYAFWPRTSTDRRGQT